MVRKRYAIWIVALLGFVIAGSSHAAALSLNEAEQLLAQKGTNLTDDDLARVATASGLTELDLTGHSRLTEKSALTLAEMPRLQSLRLTRTRLTEESALEKLAKSESLRHLDLSQDQSFRGAGLQHFVQLNSLNLACRRGSLGDAGLKYLEPLTQLESLNLGDVDQITDKGLVHLHGLTELRALDLYGCHRITDSGFNPLFAKLTKLEDLSIAFCWWHQGEKLQLPGGLVHVDLNESKRLQDAAIVRLDKSRLRTLNLFECLELTDAAVASLRDLPRLEILNLGQIRALTDASLRSIAGNTRLTQLNLSDNDNFTSAGLVQLAGLTELRDLDLWHCEGIDSAGLDVLRDMNQLKRLSLANCRQIDDTALRHLQDRESLVQLHLDFCPQLTSAGLQYLADLPDLQELTLAGCEQLDDKAIIPLSQMKSLKYLSLEYCPLISDQAVESLRLKLPTTQIIR